MAHHPDLGTWYDSSQLSLFQLCPRRYYFRYELGLQPAEASESTDLTFGTAIHKALEDLYHGNGQTFVPCPHRFEGDKDCNIHLEDETTWQMFASFLTLFPQHLEGKYKTQLNGLKLLSHYIKKWKNEPFKVIAVEQPFSMDMGDFRIVGRIDLIVDYEEGAGTLPLDHKTPGRLSPILESGYRFDMQISTYIAATTKPEQPLRAAIINNLSPSAKISNDSLVRYMQTRQQWDIDEWEQDVRQTVKEINLAKQEGYWRKHAFACTAYYRECEYRALCLTPPSNRQKEIETLYKVERWEPF